MLWRSRMCGQRHCCALPAGDDKDMAGMRTGRRADTIRPAITEAVRGVAFVAPSRHPVHFHTSMPRTMLLVSSPLMVRAATLTATLLPLVLTYPATRRADGVAG